MELYLDTADINSVKKLYRTLPLQGITTNPTIIAKTGRPIFDILMELQDIIEKNGRLFAQVIGRDTEQMVEEALSLTEKLPSLIVKIPVTEAGIAAIKQLTALNIPTLGTAVYGAGQGFLAALAGAKYIAPYVNRIDSQNGNGINTVRELQTLLERNTPETSVLAASFRTPRQVLDCMLAGCQAITVAPDIIRLFLNDPAVFAALDIFEQDWRNRFKHNRL